MIGDLRREINRDTKRDAQNIQGRQERMAAQVTDNVPPKNAKILRCHSDELAASADQVSCGEFSIR
jgi:hypothetical protein